MNKTESISITGMACSSCALTIEKALNKIEEVEKATVNFAMEKADVEFDDTSVKREYFVNQIKDLGYEVIGGKNTTDRMPEIRGGCCG